MYDRSLALGGAALGAAGGGLFGQLLSAADMPRRSAWNIPAKLAEGDLVGALPGLLGVGAGGLAAATGFGLPAAIGIGSLVGGLGQAAGESADEERFRAPTPEDVTGSDNWLLNALVGAVGDPLTYAGGFGGGRAGAKAGAYLNDLATRPLPAMLGGQVDEAPAIANALEQWHGTPPATPDMPPLNLPEAGVNPFDLVDNPPPVPEGWGEIAAASPARSSSAMGDPFYSRLQRALEEDPAKMYKTAGLEKRLLAGKIGSQGPINPDELKYTGVGDLISGGPMVSKNELLKALEEQGLRVDRKVLGTIDPYSPVQFGERALRTPGGTDYKETLLQLPPGVTETPYIHDHNFELPDIMAWLRTQEKRLPGNERMLFADEIQSDLHQTGKKYGYGQAAREAKIAELEGLVAANRQKTMDMERQASIETGLPYGSWKLRHYMEANYPEWQTLDEIGKKGLNDFHKARTLRITPDAPFKETWPDLALKQLMHDAAKGNFDRVGWNSGEAIQKVVGGGLEGQQQFYDKALPARANKLLKALGVEGGVEPIPYSGRPFVPRSQDDMAAAMLQEIEQAYPNWTTDPAHRAANARLGEMAERQLRTGTPANWEAFPNIDPDLMNSYVMSKPPPAAVGHQIRMTPELRAAILKGLPLLSLGGAAGGSGALLAALMNGEGA